MREVQLGVGACAFVGEVSYLLASQATGPGRWLATLAGRFARLLPAEGFLHLTRVTGVSRRTHKQLQG